MTFSKIPYYLNKNVMGNTNNPRMNPPNSKYSALKLKTGNCLSYSYYLQNLLKKKGYNSYIIPSKPPNQYSREGYSHLSHIAVVLPYNKGYIIMDPSIYVKEPIILEPYIKKEINMKSPYGIKNQIWTFNLQQLNENELNYSNKVSIPKKTPIVHGLIYTNDNKNQPYDYFKYYIREILNPDLSITNHTNKSDKRIFVASSTKDGNPLAYTCLNMDDLSFSGYYKMYRLPKLYLNNVKSRNELLSWYGLSDTQAKNLRYKNPLQMKTEFLEILKKMEFILIRILNIVCIIPFQNSWHFL